MKSAILFFFTFFGFLPFSFSQIDHWESVLYADGVWSYFLGNNEPPASWNELAFDDSSWASGQGGIGYGDGDDNTIIPSVVSVYMRQSFTISDFSKIEYAVLHADFDDSFVAYINGVEIARANIFGSPPAHDDEAITLREAEMYGGGDPVFFGTDKNFLEQFLVEGENVLSVQVHNYDGLASSDLTALFWFSVAINDDSNDYGPVPSWFESPIFTSELPIVKVNTFGNEIPNEPSVPGFLEIVWNGQGVSNSSLSTGNELAVNMEIERRGQSSLFFPKNGFAIETKDEQGEDMDVSFLNFPEEEDWVLHGPYSDKTLLRNVLTMQLANDMGQYASRTRLVELLINGGYEGVYVMMEKIKQDDVRVDVADLNEDDLSGDELTGGYVIKIDKDDPDWFSEFDVANNPGVKLEFQYVSPRRSKIQLAQQGYIQEYVNNFERSLKSSDLTHNGLRYDEYIDLKSFAEHFIITELSRNVDGYRLSTYLHKKKITNGGKLYAGPVWDYNIAWSNADYCGSPSVEGWMYNEPFCIGGTPFWWEVMVEDEAFVNTLNCRWTELREGPFHMDSIFAFIDEKVDLLGPAAERNFERWPVIGEYVWPNPVIYNSYEEEIEALKNWIAGRLEWMDENMLGECLETSSEELILENKIKVWPNPTDGIIQIEFPFSENRNFEFKLFDVFGKTILKGENNQKIILEDIEAGSYYLMIDVEGEKWIEKVVVF